MSADLHLQIIPGTDIILYNAIGRRLLDQGLIDKDFINNHTEGFAPYKEQVNKISLKQASKLCGVSIAEIKKRLIS